MDANKRAKQIKKLNKEKKHSDPRIFRKVCLTNTTYFCAKTSARNNLNTIKFQ